MKNILITGISRGLGLEITRHLLQDENNNLFGISRTESVELKQLREQYPNRLKWHPFDLGKYQNIEKELFTHFIPHQIPLHVLINNAAILYKDLVLRADPEKLSNLLNINLIAPILLTKFALRNFICNKTAGNTINISSICAHEGFNGLSMMGASKSGLEAFCRATAREYGSKGIRANNIVIGMLEIGMSDTISTIDRNALTDRAATQKPTDSLSVLKAIDLLMSNHAESITGQSIHVNGGIL